MNVVCVWFAGAVYVKPLALVAAPFTNVTKRLVMVRAPLSRRIEVGEAVLVVTVTDICPGPVTVLERLTAGRTGEHGQASSSVKTSKQQMKHPDRQSCLFRSHEMLYA